MRRLSDKDQKSKHVVICAAGFLQEQDNFFDMWKGVIKTFKHAEVYSLVWTSCSLNDFFESGTLKNGKEITAYKKLLHALNIYNTGYRQFLFAEDQARLSGAMLAFFLLKSKFFKGRAISLIGYSLGTQVVMHCIKTLRYFFKEGNAYAGMILHDI